MEPREIEAALLTLLAAPELQVAVPSDRVEDVRDLVIHGEYGVAAENLCENLNEGISAMDERWLEAFEDIVLALQLDSHYLNLLRKLRNSE